MLDIDKLVDDYHKNHDVQYEMRAVVDGEVVVKYTSSVSFDDLVGDINNGDEAIIKHILTERDAKLDYDSQVAEENLMEALNG